MCSEKKNRFGPIFKLLINGWVWVSSWVMGVIRYGCCWVWAKYGCGCFKPRKKNTQLNIPIWVWSNPTDRPIPSRRQSYRLRVRFVLLHFSVENLIWLGNVEVNDFTRDILHHSRVLDSVARHGESKERERDL